ncbi:hypothetical protein M9H77_22353 [Catharanthus roseus]|uniref:Uncharacterized protein n=1 Tax=Catharanthus roseus TaxID=4058 RepID=A0ACC0ARQ3_CATRO|nr:hypothetical protein M9H77_22353 [Catharanthus roseus]
MSKDSELDRLKKLVKEKELKYVEKYCNVSLIYRFFADFSEAFDKCNMFIFTRLKKSSKKDRLKKRTRVDSQIEEKILQERFIYARNGTRAAHTKEPPSLTTATTKRTIERSKGVRTSSIR